MVCDGYCLPIILPMPDLSQKQSVNAAKQLPELFELLQPHLRELDRFLLEQVEAFEPEIRKHVSYSLENGGKRIRPSLIFFSGWQEEGRVDSNLIKLAAVIETVHLATLVHDDIMDGAEIRRNRATVAREYGNTTAVLLGDALFSHAVFLSTQFPTTEICRNVAASMRKVCTGEILQTMQRGDPDISMETYRRVIDLKTAELFRVACNLGARLSGFDADYVEASGRFGRSLGIAYQIYDDLTDLFGSQEKIGKTLGTDIATGKATMPIILLRDRLPDQESMALRSQLAGESEAEVDRWLAKLREMGIFEEVRDAIFEEIRHARSAIDPFTERAAADYLRTVSSLLWNQVDAL